MALSEGEVLVISAWFI